MRRDFRVSTKAAIFNKSRDRVIVIHMDQRNDWGLPGGHIEQGETPDEAIVREIYEECGVKSSDLQPAGFFMHSNGKLILAYTGTTQDDTLKSTQNNLEGIPKWLSRDEFLEITIEPNYQKLVLENWAS